MAWAHPWSNHSAWPGLVRVQQHRSSKWQMHSLPSSLVLSLHPPPQRGAHNNVCLSHTTQDSIFTFPSPLPYPANRLGASLSIATPLGGSGAALPSLTTVVRKGRTPKRGTASGLFDLPDDPSTHSMSPTSSPRHEASSMVLTTEDAHAAVNNANIAEKIWGHLYCMKQQIKKYSAGKIALDELQSRNQATLKRILKFVQPRRPTNPLSLSSSPTSSPNFIASSPSSSFNSSSSLNIPVLPTSDSYTANAIPRLMYVLQLDNFVVYLFNPYRSSPLYFALLFRFFRAIVVLILFLMPQDIIHPKQDTKSSTDWEETKN